MTRVRVMITLLGRVCSVCGVLKLLDEFPKNGKDVTGSQQHRKDCSSCYNIVRSTTCKKGRRNYKKFVASMRNRTGETVPMGLQEWKKCMIYFVGSCAYCGISSSRTIKLTKDHLVPCVAGGGTTVGNVVPACKRCNCSKGSRSMTEWYPHVSWYSVVREKHIVDWVRKCDYERRDCR